MTVPAVLLPYQQRWVADTSAVKVAEKGRRTGLTWAEAADSVLLAATEGRSGMDVMYISYNQDMTREFIGACGEWITQFSKAASEVEEFIYKDGKEEINAFRIRFDSGHEILALSSRPKNLRGKQGRVIIDEAAFVEDLMELLKAALAFLIWGGQVRIISTHNGEDNPFNQLIEEVRAGKYPYSLHRITFDDALTDGLYKRICLVLGQEWSPEAEAAWRQETFDNYGDAADEELKCIPAKGGGRYLLRTVVEAVMSPHIPVLRWTPPHAKFVDDPDDSRYREVLSWCEGVLDSALTHLVADARSWFGEDFARSLDLTAIWPLQGMPSLTYHTPFVLELRDCPFSQQEQILFYLLDRLPRLSGGALDKGGNGAFLAERARQKCGSDLIQEVSFSEAWNLANWPPFKQALEDRTISLPRDEFVMDDMMAVAKVRGVPKVPRDERTKEVKGDKAGKATPKRHGDTAVAAALALFAARTIDAEPFQVISAAPYRATTLFRGYR